MQKVTDVIVQGEDENGHGFESIVLKDETGAQWQLFVRAGALELVKLEPTEAEETDDEIAERMNELFDDFEGIFNACNDPNCACKK